MNTTFKYIETLSPALRRVVAKDSIRAHASLACRRKHAMHVLCESIRTGAMKINAAVESAKTFATYRKLAAIKRIVDANADKKMALIRFSLALPIDDLEDFLELASLHKLTRLYRRDFVEESRAEFSKLALPKSAREINFEVHDAERAERKMALAKMPSVTRTVIIHDKPVAIRAILASPKLRRIKTVDQSKKSAFSK